MFDSIRETIDYSVENNISFADMMINDEMEREVNLAKKCVI